MIELEGNRLKDLERDMYLFNKEELYDSYHIFGNKKEEEGVRFTVWAPNAREIKLVGDFNQWKKDIRMNQIKDSGSWTILVPNAKNGDCYKYLITQVDGEEKYKIDPYALEYEVRPKDASIVRDIPAKKWKDGSWMAARNRWPVYNRPMNIYEVHLSSWKNHEDGSWYSIKELEAELIPFVKEMGFTHIEFMPLVEHPLDASWGYQATGFFALSSKFGTMEDLQNFIEKAHIEGIGIIMDWVPGHFNRNDYAMAYFDGGAQYEYLDSNQANNNRWGTLNFDLGKNEVQNFLISNALFWIEEFHIDGLRVDAVSNMLYLDYDIGEWTPNEDGGNENLEGIDFIQKMNTEIFKRHPALIVAAEESTAWEGVTTAVSEGGLGFNYKWNMGWMNDTLKFFEMDPVFRKDHFQLITFSFVYTFNENFILPFSHDEVVHGKKSLMHKMHGDRYNQFAALRTLQSYQFFHPGKKLNFMGNEFGQFLEWRFDEELEWEILTDQMNQAHLNFMKELNHFYKDRRALWERDHDSTGIEILDANNADESLLYFIRKGKKARDFLIICCNFTPVERQKVKVGVPYRGVYEEVWNTELKELGGTWEKGNGRISSKNEKVHQQEYSIEVVLPSLSVTVFAPKRIYGLKEKTQKKIKE
ncbi:MAG: 1,4-alpha-glucan branching protein GlgB [Atopostipes suicloacalis]|nr:1,4-alpha-glucan branching protein GlgB [Atopostipes suicloacalis]